MAREELDFEAQRELMVQQQLASRDIADPDVLEAMRRKVESLVFHLGREGVEVSTTLSAGVAFLPPSGGRMAELLARADESLLQAKKQGRNRIVIASPPDCVS